MLRIEARKEEHTPRTGLRLISNARREYDPGALYWLIACAAPFVACPRIRGECGWEMDDEICPAFRAPPSGAG